MWKSWAYFAYSELGTVHEWRGLSDVLEDKMDNESCIFGVPPHPPEYEQFPEWVSMRQNLKGEIATRAINACLERIKVEALLRMERTLQDNGLEGFKLILNSDSIIEELAKISMSYVNLQDDE